MFRIYRDTPHQRMLDKILEGKQTRTKLSKIDIKVPVEELPGEDIEDVYGAYAGHADDLLGVLVDIENQLNKDKTENLLKFKNSVKDFIEEMGEQKAFIFAYKNKEGLNASLYTTQVEFNNACRAKKRSIKAAAEFSDAFAKHVCSCNSLLKDFGNLDEKKLGILSDVMDKILSDENNDVNKAELGKLFDAMAARCLNRIPHQDEKDQLASDSEGDSIDTDVLAQEVEQQHVIAQETEVPVTAEAEEQQLDQTPAVDPKVEAAQRSAQAFYKKMKKFYE